MDATISYTPIPIKTIPKEKDVTIPKEKDVFLSLDGICPRRDELADQTNVDNFRNFCTSNSQIIEYLYNHTGQEFLKDPLADAAKTFKDIIPTFDTVLILYESNIFVEDWINSEFMQASIPKIRTYQFNVFKRRTERPESLRLQAGPLVDLITQNFKDYNIGLITQKMISYSGHDKSLYNLMTSIGIYDPQFENLPPYASALFMELHQNPAQIEPVIEFWYRNETSRQPYRLISSKCGNPCTLSSLVDATSEFANINFDEECKAKGSTQN
ncbi:unnamed protein product [Allacma fusca]|uniref:acid phosphatase n=1 Tax=Allacma fusca TaxID=39272 RepID=A0A8J2Q021_9HEXA|nr:unnamed protein product [Allacma fusca]